MTTTIGRRRTDDDARTVASGYHTISSPCEPNGLDLLKMTVLKNRITKTRPCNIQQFFMAVKMIIFR